MVSNEQSAAVTKLYQDQVRSAAGAGVPREREKVRFVSTDTECAAWHYPGSNGACVIMAGGGGVTKEPGTDPFARRFNDAGFTVLAFDYRHLGESGGQPRQVIRIREQLADWQAAIAFASTLPEVDPARLAIWGFSLSGGHVFRVAARNPQLAAAIAQTPLADGPVAARKAVRHTTPLAMLRVHRPGRPRRRRRSASAGSRCWCRPPASPGPSRSSPRRTASTVRHVRSIRTTGTRTGSRRSPPAPRFASGSTGPAATRPACGARCSSSSCDQDQSGPCRARRPARRGERRRESSSACPAGTTHRSWSGHEQAVEAELSFLRRHLLDHSRADRRAAPADSARTEAGRA